MKILFRLFFTLSFISFLNNVYSQKVIRNSLYSSEIEVYSFSDKQIYVAKRYTPVAADTLPTDGMMTYLDLPIQATNVVGTGDLFITTLFCMQNGKILWEKEIGQSNTSTPPKICMDAEGNIFCGEKTTSSQVTIRKLNINGDELWHTTLDSLESVHAVYADENKEITALVSFTTHQQKNTGSGTYSIVAKNIYHTVWLDKETGRKINKIQNQGPTYFCSLGYATPVIGSQWVDYSFAGDSLIYSRTDTVQMLVISQDITKDCKILAAIGHNEKCAALTQRRSDQAYQLAVNMWGGNKLSSALKLSIPSSSQFISLHENPAGGYYMCFADHQHIYISTTEPFNLLNYQATINNGAKMFDVISDMVRSEDGSYYIAGIRKANNSRELIYLHVNEKGEIIK